MYVDESGGTEETVTSEDVTVTVEGHEYEVEKNMDIDSDGHVDTAIIQNGDGTRSAYIDEDADGDADVYLEADEQGNTVAEARFDAASGEWIAVDNGSGQPTPTDTPTSGDTPGPDKPGSDKPMTADMPAGEITVGPATIDTDEDGVNDTAVTKDDDGTTYYFTDVNGDGAADYALVVEDDGTTAALKHTGDGQWERADAGTTQTSSGAHGDHQGDQHGGGTGIGGGMAEAAGDDGGVANITSHVEGVAKIDPHTGQWLSPN